MTAAANSGMTRRDEKRTLSVASGAHALHDGYTDLIYIMLPVWQAEFGLTYAAVGALRGLFAGTLASLLILGILPLPLEAAFAILPLLGIALNGTSSVLYGSVPALVAPAARTRAFGQFYTGTIGAGAVAPILYDFLGDQIGLTGSTIVVGAMVLITLPLAFALRPAFLGTRP
jgi:hypothetical protein